MTKFFISYSRKDIEFSRKLASSLEHLGFESWIDWNDIPPTADWWDQIEKGIETSDTFLFLISPDSVASETCRKEIDHAVRNGKRIIPIVVHDPAWDSIPPAIAKLNFVFFRTHDNYETALKKLDTAIRIDLAWVEAHRRLQVRALDWQKRKERSLLLRGDDLRVAEEQLAASGQKNPQPTDLQRKYLLESRRSDSRTRSLIGLVIMLVAIALVYIASYSIQSSTKAVAANKNAATAESMAQAAKDTTDQALQETEYQLRQSRIGLLSARSEQLAAESSSISLLLALEAARLSDDAGEPITEGTRHALQDALTSVQGNAVYANDKNVTVIAFSPNGHWLASAGEDSIVRLWDRDPSTTSNQPILLEGHQGAVNSLAFNNDSTRLASGGEDGVVRIWDLVASDPSKDPIEIPVDGRVTSLAWDSHGRWLAASIADQGMAIVDMDASEPEAATYLSSNYTGLIYINDSTGDCETEDEPWMGTGLISRKVSNCTYEVHSVGGIGDVYVTAKLNESWFVTTNPSRVDLWKIPTTDPPTPSLKADASFAAFSPDGNWLATAKPGEIDLWSLNPLIAKPISFSSDERKGGAVYGFASSPDGKWLALSNSYRNEVLLWEVPKLSSENAGSIRKLGDTRFLSLTGHTGPVTALVFSPDGRWLATSSGDVAHLGAGAEVASQFNALSGDGTTRLWDLSAIGSDTTSIDPVYVMSTNSQHAALAFSPDSQWLAVSSEDLLLRLFNLDMKNFGIDPTILESIGSMDFSELSNLVCQHAARNFTIAEWERYFPNEPYPAQQENATCPQWPAGK